MESPSLNTQFLTYSDGEKAKAYLAWFRPHFETAFHGFLDAKIREANQINPEAAVLVEEIKRFAASGGKRIRPAFLYSGYIAAGGMSHDAAIFASISVELLHTFALIHDDIIDKSDLRREKPTTHKIFEKLHQKRKLIGSSTQYGLSSAILAGDLAFSLAEEILTIAPFPQERLRRARNYFDKLKSQVIYGEYLDVLSGYKNEITEDEVLQILDLKTARYTIERPLHIGAILAGAEPNTLHKLTAYAVPLGQAFQIQDDVIGTFGREEEIGKPSDSDIKEGKKTLLLIKALEKATPIQKKILKEIVGNQKANEEQVDQVRKILVDTGSYDYSVALAKKLITQSKSEIENADLVVEGKDYLVAAADYLLSRKL
jgi:geranylgeranyl diphosphate synthase, type I